MRTKYLNHIFLYQKASYPIEGNKIFKYLIHLLMVLNFKSSRSKIVRVRILNN